MGGMQCKEYDDLEQAFMEVRRRQLSLWRSEQLTPDLEDELSRAELEALFALLDHRAEHGCQPIVAGQASAKAPASRNMGGVIGPY